MGQKEYDDSVLRIMTGNACWALIKITSKRLHRALFMHLETKGISIAAAIATMIICAVGVFIDILLLL